MGKAPLVPAAYKGPSTGKALFKRENAAYHRRADFLEDFSDLAPKERLAAMTEELNARIKELEKKLEQL